jgi:hypothetical protein
MSTLEGVVEPVEPQQIGPGNAPGPLEPRVVDHVETARRLKKELGERYPGVAFSVRSNNDWYPDIHVTYTDGPSREEIELLAQEYVGYREESHPLDEFPHYSPLPGKWVGGLFLRYDVAYIMVERRTGAGGAQAHREWDEIWHQ